MIYYAFDPDTGVLAGQRMPQVDPRETDLAGETVYTLPGRFETPVAPPTLAEKQTAVWSGSAWSVVSDYRGETWYAADGTEAKITAVGDPAGLGLSASVPPPPPPNASDLRAYAAEKRWAVETGGCPWNGHIIATDRDSQTKLLAEFVAIGGGVRAEPGGWKMAGGDFVLLTNADMTAAIMASRAHIAAAFAAEAAVLAAIGAGSITTLAEIDAAAWPSNS